VNLSAVTAAECRNVINGIVGEEELEEDDVVEYTQVLFKEVPQATIEPF
jgi:hypothetical protein